MHYKFDITLTDNDYLDYNLFHQIRSPYGKKTINKFRILLTVIPLVFIVSILIGDNFSKDAFIDCIPNAIVFVVFQLFLNKLMAAVLKGHIRFLKKTGKMGYSPKAVMEFYDDTFVEITPDEKTERKYTAIERVSVVENRVVYLHVNNVMAYILPMHVFESREQYYFFMSFIKTKCPVIDSYN